MAIMYNPAHPGEILANYMQGRTVTEVAAHLGVTRVALSRVLNGKAGISAEMAIRIGSAFGTDPDFGCGCRISAIYGRQAESGSG